MISLKKSPSSKIAAIIRDDEEESPLTDKIVYVDPATGIGRKSLCLLDEYMEIFPTQDPERVYISGPNGSGKSYISGVYARNYNMIFPKNKIVLISPHADTAYTGVTNILKLDINDESLYDESLDLSRFQNTLIIFDDIDGLANKKNRLFLENFQKEVIMNGRKLNIHCLSISHMLMNSNQTRHIISEATRTVIFPQAGSTYHIDRYLKIYCGFTKEVIQQILRINSRWVCVNNTAPQYVLYDKGIYLVQK